MKWLRIILFILATLALAYTGLWLVGFVYSAFWYLLWLGLVGVSVYAGYRFLTRKSRRELDPYEYGDSLYSSDYEAQKIQEDMRRRTLK
jgi:membrane protein implicated in regulation of membrane protease activity